MVYESDFYTTRRPYRTTPSYTSYTTSPSRQVRVLPGLGKVHVTYTYDRVVPYVGHKRLTVVTSPPKVYSTRPSVLQREFERIENKLRPWYAYSATNRYLNSDSAVRINYISYPLTGYDYSYSLNLPSNPYLPKVYRWYYSWPRLFNASSYLYWPYYRSYLTSYLRNYYLSDYYPSSYYWSSYRPYYKSLDYEFGELEDKIDNIRKMIYLDYPYPIKAVDYPYYPNSYKTYRPLTLYYDYYWPISSLNRYRDNWPYYPYYRYLYYKYTLPSDRYYHLKGIFDDETRLIRAQTASLLKRIHNPVPRVQRFSWPIAVNTKVVDSLPARLSNDYYIHKLLHHSPSNTRADYTTYYTEPVRKYIGHGHLSCVSYAGERAYNRRPHIYLYEDPMRNDIQLLSFYINKFKQEKAQSGGGATITEITKVPLSPARPSRKFTANKVDDNEETAKEMQKLREARAARMAYIQEESKIERTTEVNSAEIIQKKEQEEKLVAQKAEAEARAKQEEEARKRAQEKKEEAARKAELARQEELAAKAAAERAAELERQAELAKQEELAKQAEIERARQLEEERLRLEEEKRLEEEAKAEEERKQLARLEQLAREAEEEREAELARQADELAELARQEAELAEQAKREAEEAELARQQEELAELERQEAELAELERKEKELAELARQEAEAAQKEAELAELAKQEAELAELERQQAELDALEAEAKALETGNGEDLPEENTTTVDGEPVEEAVSEHVEEEEDEDARKQREMDEIIQRKFELAQLEKQQAELDALDAEARALAEDTLENGTVDDDEEDAAIAEDTPLQSDEEAEE